MRCTAADLAGYLFCEVCAGIDASLDWAQMIFFFFAKWYQVVSSLLSVFSELVCVCVITSLHPSDYFLHLTVNNDRRRSRFSATRLHNIYCACASRLVRPRLYLQITFEPELKLRLWTSFSRTMTWSKLCSALLRMIQWNVASCL